MEQQGEAVRGRFAPSPSGRMHLGNLFSALLSWLSVRSVGGTLVLRMEDLDPDRCRPAYAEQLCEDLRWLGLDWDEGYQVASAPQVPYLQSRRTAYYAAVFGKLEALGLVYPCYCTRAERLAASAPHRSDGQAVYDGRCRILDGGTREALSQGRRPAFRLSVPDQIQSAEDRHLGYYAENLLRDCGDFIIRRSDGVYAYQLAVVADDGAMGITQVVRGRDLLHATPRQCYLYDLLDLPVPTFYHVPLLCAPDGRRLSKRDRDLDMGVLRARFAPEALLGRLAFLAGVVDRPVEIAAHALIPLFSWDRVPKDDILIWADLLN